LFEPFSRRCAGAVSDPYRVRSSAVPFISRSQVVCVVQQAWTDAGNTSPPTLFGQEFELVPAGNRYGIPAFYELHAWIWKHNPSGMFSDWNPGDLRRRVTPMTRTPTAK
jgi:hypothetical protein